MTTAELAEIAWGYRADKETISRFNTTGDLMFGKPRAKRTNRPNRPYCTHSLCTKYAVEGYEGCGNHAKKPCPDCQAPVSILSTRCPVCAKKFMRAQRDRVGVQ